MSWSDLDLRLNASACAALVLVSLLYSASANAQTAPIGPSDTAVSGFSGTVLASPSLAGGVDPIDKTVIDLDGVALRVFDLSSLGGTPSGQTAQPPVKLEVKAKDIGQVFGLAFDDGKSNASGVPYLYAAATSAYGLQIVAGAPDSEGAPVRLKSGAADARFMDGQFSGLPGGGPGSIWKIDGSTGAAALFASTAANGVANSGPGLGGLAFDPQSRSIYAADLDTGLIHRFAADTGARFEPFDHGLTGRPARGLPAVADDGKRMEIADPAFKPDDISMWGLTQPERRVHGLAVHGGRLYYSVAEGPEIWSVGLNADGGFASDTRSEVFVKAQRPLAVTSIAFDTKGRMLLAQRPELKNSYDYSRFTDGGGAQVLRYAPEQPDDPATPGSWTPEPETYAVGYPEGSNMAEGGLSLQYAYRPDGTIDTETCDSTILATGDHLPATSAVDGVQVFGADLVRPANSPPQQSVYFDFDARQNDPTARGYVGDVKTFALCAGTSGGTGFPPVVDRGGDAGPKDGGFPPVVDQGGGGGGFPPIVDQGGGGGGGGGFPPIVDQGGGGGGGGFPPVVDAEPGEGGGGAGTPGMPPEFPPVVDQPTTPGQTPAQQGALKVVKKPAPGVAKCSPKGGCTFEITISNPTAVEVPGPITIDDTLFDAPNAARTGDPSAPWECTKSAPFSCKHPGPLAANGSLTLMLTFAPNTPSGKKEIKNCAVIHTEPPTSATQPPPAEAIPPGAPGGTGPLIDPNAPKQLQRMNLGGPTIGERICQGILCIVIDGQQPNGRVTFRIERNYYSEPNHHYNVRSFAGQIQEEIPPGGSATVAQERISIQYCVNPGSFVDTSHCDAWVAFDLRRLEACDNYADDAHNQVERSGGCGLTGDQWDPDRNHHLSWCMNLSADDFPSATVTHNTEREFALSDCTVNKAYCQRYADEAVAAANSNIAEKCNYTRPPGRWSTVGNEHYQWCRALSPDQSWPATESAKRSQGLEDCRLARLGILQSREGRIGDLKKPVAGGGGFAKDLAAEPPPEQCATIPLDPDMQVPAPAPPESAQTGPLTIEKTRTVETCTETGVCSFAIVVTNTSDQPSDKITVEDIAKLDNGAVPTALSDDPKPWTCVSGPGTITCELPSVAPKSKSPPLPASFRPVIGSKQIENCATIKGTANKACASIPITQPGQPQVPPPLEAEKLPKFPPDLLVGDPNIRVEMKAKSAHCNFAYGCYFDITVTNAGAATYQGKIALNFVVIGFPEAAFGSGTGWTCTSVRDLLVGAKCIHDETTILPGGQRFLTASFNPTAAIRNDIVKTCATYYYDYGNDPGTIKIDDEACAEVQLDPFAVKMAKTGDQSCQPGGECRFDLKLFNPGPIDHNAPVTLTDGLSGIGPADIVSITPPLACATQPTQIPFTCTSPGNHPLKIGAEEHFSVTIRLPPEPKTGAFTNCASVAGVEGDDKPGAGGPATCHTVQIGSGSASADTSKSPSGEPKLVVEKIATATSCTDAGGGCTFDIVVRNIGTGPFPGPIEIQETVKADGALAASSNMRGDANAPWACSKAAPAKFACTHPGPLDPGKEARLQVNFGLRADTGAKEIENCAALKGSSEQACAKIPLGAPADTPPPPVTCHGGMVPTKVGRCACPPGTIWQRRECVADTSGGGISTSKDVPDESKAEQAPKPKGGGSDTSRDTDRGKVEQVPKPKVCPPTRPVGTYPNCCPRDTIFSNGTCAKIGGGATPSREPPAGKPLPKDTGPLTEPGTKVGPILRKVCPPDRPVGTYPNCCPKGTTYVNGACAGGGFNTSREPPAGKPLPKDTGPLTEPGTKVGPILRKVCPPDRPVGTYPNCCPKGTIYTKDGCAGGSFNTSREPPPRDPTKGKVEQVPKSNACPPDRPIGKPPICCPVGTTPGKAGCFKPKSSDQAPDVNKNDILTKPSGGIGDFLKNK